MLVRSSPSSLGRWLRVRTLLRACVAALTLSILIAPLSACGGESAASKPTEKPLQVNPATLSDDPDSAFPSGTDILTTLSDLGSGHYQLTVQNESPLGTINTFTWTPPADLHVTALTGSSVGHCNLQGRSITCQTMLVAPKCTCKPGGITSVHFKGIVSSPRSAKKGVAIHAQLPGGIVTVGVLTPVPFVIPSSPSQPVPASADLPFCKPNQHTSRAHPCIETG
jgi:hypothetical protein